MRDQVHEANSGVNSMRELVHEEKADMNSMREQFKAENSLHIDQK